jgi:DNA-binding transcriptional MerR regulator
MDTQLDPDSEAALRAQQRVGRSRSELAEGLTGRLQDEFGGRVNFDDFTSLAGVPQANDETRQRAEDAMYGRMTSRLDPRFQQEEGDLRSRLYNQGLTEGDSAFQREIDNFGRGRTDAYQTAMNESIMGGGAEQSRLFGMEMDAGGRQNQTRQQQIAESMQERGYSLNEINAMLTGQQVGMPQMPSFSTASRSEGNQALQAAQLGHEAELDSFNADQAATQGMMSGAAGMFAFSDRRLKRKIKRIGSLHKVPIYSFEYIWGEKGVGVMADEVTHIPGAVVMHDSGFLMVDYGEIYGRA